MHAVSNFIFSNNTLIYLIHDRTGRFLLNYMDHGIKHIEYNKKQPHQAEGTRQGRTGQQVPTPQKL